MLHPATFRCLATATAAASTSHNLLLRTCVVLYQQQNAPDSKLHPLLSSIGFHLSHEFFLQLCARFPLSPKPLLRFHHYAFTHRPDSLQHTPITTNKLLDIIGKSQNPSLLWYFLSESSNKALADSRSYLLAARAFAAGNQINKLVSTFHLVKAHNPNLVHSGFLNMVVEELCRRKLVDAAVVMVKKLRPLITPDAYTYGLMVVGLCRGGDLVGASKMWRKIVEEELQLEVECYMEMMTIFFKINRVGDAINMFVSMRNNKFYDMCVDSYGCFIVWMCKLRKVETCLIVVGEMFKRGFGVDWETLGALVYAFVVRRKLRDGHKILHNSIASLCRSYCFSKKNDGIISVYHGMLKGLVGLKRVGDATNVFREMCERGCEPTMHTYIMLLQGHMGKKGRKGKDPHVNFGSIFVGGLVKVGRTVEATKFVERMMEGGVRGKDIPRFDYCKFLHCFSNEEGVVMFEEVGRRMKEVGMEDLGDVFLRYGEKMATRDRRRRLPDACLNCIMQF